MWLEKWASPRALSATRAVSRTAYAWSPALHANVPVTALAGPGVPMELVELMVSPSTSKKVAPFDRFTRSAADPDIPSSRASTGACDGASTPGK